MRTKLSVLAITIAAAFSLACSSDPLNSQEYTSQLNRIAQNNGLEKPELLESYTPVHAEDRDYRVCYKVSAIPSAEPECLVHDSEHGPAQSFNGYCRGDRELPDGYAWCGSSYIQEEFELRYGEKTAFIPSMIRGAQRNGLEAPMRVDVGHPDANCFKRSPGDDATIVCWYERIDPINYAPISACTRGYAGSFWCTYGENGPPELNLSLSSPVSLESWTWSWIDGRS